MAEDGVTEDEKNLNVEKAVGEDDAAVEVEKEAAKDETEEKEPEDKVKELIRVLLGFCPDELILLLFFF